MEILDPKPADGSTTRSSACETGAAASVQKPEAEKPANFLPWAILSTLFCCLPFGIVAIVYSTQVDSYWFSGNREAAFRSAKRARTWTWVSVGVAVGCWVIYLLLAVVLGLLSWSAAGL